MRWARRWIAGKHARQRGVDHRDLGAQRLALCGAVGDEQVGDPRHDHVAGGRMGHSYGIRLNTIAPGEIPTEGMSKRIKPGDEAGARTTRA